MIVSSKNEKKGEERGGEGKGKELRGGEKNTIQFPLAQQNEFRNQSIQSVG